MENDYPKISIIVACLNEERFIWKCIESLLEQDYKGEFDIIIADGVSTDKTVEILTELSEKHSKIIIINNPDKIQAAGRNLAISISDADFIAYLDAHRYADKSWLSELWNCYEEFSKIDKKIAGAGSVHYDAAKTVFSKAQEIAFKNIISGATSSNFLNFRSAAKVDHACMCLYNKKIFLEAGSYNSKLKIGEDIELNHRLTQKLGYSLYQNPKAVNYYYPRENPVSLFKQQYNYGLWRQIVIKILEEIPSKGKVKKENNNNFLMKLKTLVPGIFVATLLILMLLSFISMHIYIIFSLLVSAYLLTIITASVNLGIKNKISPTILIFVFVAIHFGYGFGVLSYITGKRKI